MDDELISVIDVAVHHGKQKQTVFKILRRLGIKTVKIRKEANKNQLVAYISQDEFRRVSEEMARLSAPQVLSSEEGEDFVSSEKGLFYLVQLEPELDPCRFKVGFASNMSERLRALRCSAPFASVIKTWPCRRLWEKTAIDCVSVNAEQIHTEVFRAVAISDVIKQGDALFGLMPPP